MFTFIRRLAKIIGLVAAVISSFAGVGPDEAISNIAGWLNLIGVKQIPGWLYPTDVDKYILRFSIPLLLLCAVIIIYPFAKKRVVASHRAKVLRRAEELEQQARAEFQERLKEQARINRQMLGK